MRKPSPNKVGVLLLNMGGPDSVESIRPFLQNLFSDREIIRFPMPAVMQRGLARLIARSRSRKLAPVYEQMGGCSPQVTYTLQQARGLERALTEAGISVTAYVGMRYWRPFIEDTVRLMMQDGISRAVVLPMYPQYSIATTGSSFNELQRVTSVVAPKIEWLTIHSWETHFLYVGVLVRLIKEALEALSDGEPPVILFSAHSLPKRFVDAGDPYPNQVRETIRATLKALGWTGESRIAFQSRVGPVRWLRPTTPEMLRTLATEGHTRVLVVPVSFVSDHIETLEEIDKEYRELAMSLGFTAFARTQAPNVRPDFIEALGALVTERLGEENQAACR